MKKNLFSRLIALVLCVCMVMSLAISASAADVANATIDTSKVGSIEIYKYDLTNAEKDGIWDSSYVSTGVKDQDVIDTLGGATREGDNDDTSDLGNGQSSNGYAIKGVEFTYLKVADVVQYTEAALDGQTQDHVEVLYGIPKSIATPLLDAIGLTANERYNPADQSDTAGWSTENYYFQSDVLINALKAALTANSTDVKNALETYVKNNGGTAMKETDADGYTKVSNLPLGLYLIVETKVPEMVVDTTDPFFVSVPMTSVDGTNATDGGTRWIYDITLFPKNLTGIPSLEKTLRETKDDTGKNGGDIADITDGYAHTGTASAGDVIDYQIISTLPSITSAATYLTEYTFLDTLSAGLTYNKNDVVLEFFSDEACTKSVVKWTQTSGNFTVTYGSATNGGETMRISMTEAGLKVINESTLVYPGDSMVNSGLSDCTVRITYQATVDSDNSLVIGDSGNPNDVVLTWTRSNSSYYDTLVDDAHLYTYGLDLTKLFSNAPSGNFNNVEFVLHNDTDGYFVKAELNTAEGIYYVTDHMVNEADATHFIPVASADNTEGKIIIKGLEDDTYTLTEVRTDNGYTLLKEDIEIVISQTEADVCDIYTTDVVGLIQNDPRYAAEMLKNKNVTSGDLADILNNIPQEHLEHKVLTASATVDGNAVTMLTDNGSVNAEAPLTVVNTRGFDLPATGETGAFILPAIGAVVMIAAVCMIFVVALPKKKEQE